MKKRYPRSTSSLTNLIVSHVATLACVLARLSAFRRRRPDVDLVAIGQRERASIHGHADDELLWLGAEFEPVARRERHVEVALALAVVAVRVERAVVTSLLLPFTVEVVRHHVDEVQLPAQNGHAIGRLSDGKYSRYMYVPKTLIFF